MAKNNCADCIHKDVCALWEIQNEISDTECVHYQSPLTPQNKWMKVDENLPDFDVPVLVYVKDIFDNKGTISITKYTITYDLRNNWLGYENSSFKITHWMSLPKPPDHRQTEGKVDGE